MSALGSYKTLLLCLLFFSFGCVSSQPRINTDTKNKKAREDFNKAIFHANSGEPQEALNKANDALKKDPEYIDALLLKGDIHKSLKEYESAELAYQKALGINSKLTDIHYYLGELYFKAMRYESCVQSLEMFLQQPVSPTQKQKAESILVNARFAVEGVKNPVAFNPINIKSINSPQSEYFPTLTVDDETLIFTRRIGKFPADHEDFYVSKKDSFGNWGKPVNLGSPVNTPYNEGTAAINAGGNFIFFACCNRPQANTYLGPNKRPERPGAVFEGCDIYFSKLEGDKWSMPRHLGFKVNSPKWESQPSLSSDGLDLYFTSTRDGGYGGSDVWVSRFENGRFGEPVNLGPSINTAGNEESPFIHPDNQTLYFSSNGWPGFGEFDFFFSRRDAAGNWQKPENLGFPINSSETEKGLLVNRKGDIAYFSSNERPEGLGGVDIYQFEMPEKAKPQVLSYLKGIVTDAAGGKPLAALVQLFDIQTNTLIFESTSDAYKGEFFTVLKPQMEYALNVGKETYLFHSENFNMKTGSIEKPFVINIQLQKPEIGKIIELKNVFFETDKFELKKESRLELEKLTAFLKQNPNLKIEVGGHTDNTGNKQLNKTLSENRAKSVKDFLITQGIDASRMQYKGYGETQPKASNDSEEGKQQNRRTEIKIIGL